MFTLSLQHLCPLDTKLSWVRYSWLNWYPAYVLPALLVQFKADLRDLSAVQSNCFSSTHCSHSSHPTTLLEVRTTATQGPLDEEFGFYPLRLQYVIQLTALFPEATLSLHSLVGPLIINSQLPSPRPLP